MSIGLTDLPAIKAGPHGAPAVTGVSVSLMPYRPFAAA